MACPRKSSSSSSSLPIRLCLIWLVLLRVANGAGLSSRFYDSTCPDVFSVVKSGVEAAINESVSNGAALLRLHFHDCFVNGCDGSVLLDDTTEFEGEKNATPNANSLAGFDIIDSIKSNLESICPGVVSCADILAIVARDAVVTLGGPTWTVLTGRRDSVTASLTAANADLPSAAMNLSALTDNFAAVGLNLHDVVALSGAHTVGVARCVNFRSRIYNETDIDSSYAAWLKTICPKIGNDSNRAPLEYVNNTLFNNYYFKDLLVEKGLLHSDQQLFSGGGTDALVALYSSDQNKFFRDFGLSMIKMGNAKVLTGSSGEVRINCRVANSASAS
ncbi:hypothetical protein Dimus_006921 [Dionaea muscipula]